MQEVLFFLKILSQAKPDSSFTKEPKLTENLFFIKNLYFLESKPKEMQAILFSLKS